jgi:hypothetical protein
MIDSILNLLFRCAHRRLTRPVTPVSKAGVPHGETYVVCLDCGKQFAYDTKEMRIGKPIDTSHEESIVPPDMPGGHKKKLRYALWASVPLAVFVSSVLKSKKPGAEGARSKSGEPHEPDPEKPG